MSSYLPCSALGHFTTPLDYQVSVRCPERVKEGPYRVNDTLNNFLINYIVKEQPEGLNSKTEDCEFIIFKES